MKLEELKALIEEQVKSAIAPLQETQRKYADLFKEQQQQQEQKGEQLEPGIRMARLAKLMVLSKNDPEKAYHLATGGANNSSKGMYPNDLELHNTLKSLSATTPSEGGFLVNEQYAQEIIPLLYAKAVVRKLGARPLPMPNGNLNLPKVTGGATSYYIGENTDAKKSKQKFGNIRLSGKKLVTLVPISNDLIRSASIEADRIVRDDMIMSMALKEDFSALYGAGTEYTPRGVYNINGVSKSALNALPTSDDIASMVGELMAKNINWGSVGWTFNGLVWSVFYNLKTSTGYYIHRDEMNQGKLLGLPFQISNQIPVNANKTDLFLGDWNEFIIGEQMGLQMEASTEATYFDGTEMVSAFSQDQTVLKVTSIHDFGVRYPEAFIVKTGVQTA